MDEAQIRDTVKRALFDVAPELEGTKIEDDEPLREAYDLDSADYLNFLIRLHERLGIEIPESDYGSLSSVGRAVAYLVQRCR